MKITGTRGIIWFDLENGYVMKAEGELTLEDIFYVNKISMKSWEPPYENEVVTDEQIDNIIKQVEAEAREDDSIKIIFD